MPKRSTTGRERRFELLAGRRRLDLQPHEEAAGVLAGELVRLGDVARGRHDGAADRVHDARPVVADQRQDPVRRRHAGKANGARRGSDPARKLASWRGRAIPTDHEPVIEVRPATGRFDDFMAVLGHTSMQANGCWCMSYRDARLSSSRAVEVHEEPVRDRSGAGRARLRRRRGRRMVLDRAARHLPPAAALAHHPLAHRSTPGSPCASSSAPASASTGSCTCCSRRRSNTQGRTAQPSSRVTRSTSRGDRVDVISGYVGTRELFEAAGFDEGRRHHRAQRRQGPGDHAEDARPVACSPLACPAPRLGPDAGSPGAPPHRT